MIEIVLIAGNSQILRQSAALLKSKITLTNVMCELI